MRIEPYEDQDKWYDYRLYLESFREDWDGLMELSKKHGLAFLPWALEHYDARIDCIYLSKSNMDELCSALLKELEPCDSFETVYVDFDVLGNGDANKDRPKDFSDFHFSGRNEFFDPPLNDLSAYPLIVEAYRQGFARGCRAGADDVASYLGLDCAKEASEAFLDGQDAMMRAIPHRKSDRADTRCEVRPIKSVRWQKERVR